jgi:DNA-binding GntR family transcriptional regulator
MINVLERGMQEYKTMTTMATEILKKGIIDGSFKPDEMLVPQNLEKRFGLGKMAFREAIRELVGLGLVNSVANKGNFVAGPPSLAELKEIFEVRCLMEKSVAVQGATVISDEDVKKLEKLHNTMKRKNISPHDFFFLNKEFHMLLYKASGWEYLYHLIDQLIEYVFMFRFKLKNRTTQSAAVFIDEHEMILKAIKRKRPEEVGRHIVKNIKSGLRDIEKRLEEEK